MVEKIIKKLKNRELFRIYIGRENPSFIKITIEKYSENGKNIIFYAENISNITGFKEGESIKDSARKTINIFAFIKYLQEANKNFNIEVKNEL